MSEKKKFSCGIIGAGRLGTSLALALQKKNFLSWVLVNSVEKRSELLKILPAEKVFSSIEEISFLPDFVFLTVRDSQISVTAKILSEKFSTELRGKNILHCSGALELDELRSCEENGATIIAAHPFQTFPYSSEKFFSGIAWGVESKSDHEEIFSLIKQLGGKGFLLDPDSPEKKIFYHLSAVAASNFLSTVIALAKEFSSLAEIPAEQFLAPIIRTTVENSLEKISDEEFPLTGPLVRQDIVTIRKHFDALEKTQNLQSAYRELNFATLFMAHEKNLLDKDQFERIFRFLESSPRAKDNF